MILPIYSCEPEKKFKHIFFQISLCQSGKNENNFFQISLSQKYIKIYGKKYFLKQCQSNAMPTNHSKLGVVHQTPKQM